MNEKTVLAALAIALCAACAGAPTAGSPPDTQIAVADRSGESVPGEYEVWSQSITDECNGNGIGCAVNVPEGDYTLTFTKVRFGRLVTSGGGNAGGERGTGCLRARIHITPGERISCTQRADYNCAAWAVETMDCGPASVVNREKLKAASAPAAAPAPAASAPVAAPAPAASAPVAAPTPAASAPAAAPAPAASTSAAAPAPAALAPVAAPAPAATSPAAAAAPAVAPAPATAPPGK